MYEQIVNPATGRKVNVDGKIGKQILQQYKEQIGGYFWKNNKGTFGDTDCLSEEDWNNKGAAGHHKNCYREHAKKSKGYSDCVYVANRDKGVARDTYYYLRKDVSGVYGPDCQTRTRYMASRAKSAAMNSEPIKRAKLNQVKKKIAHLNQQKSSIDSHIKKYNDCIDPRGAGVRTDVPECRNLRCIKVAGKDDCNLAKIRLESQLLEANAEVKKLQDKIPQRNSMFSNIGMPTMKMSMPRMPGMMKALRQGKQAEAEGLAALKHAQVNDPVDCSKCAVVSSAGHKVAGEEYRCTSIQSGGGKRRNAKRTSKKRNASKKRRNASKNNNRR